MKMNSRALSHPDKLLRQHLYKVGDNSKKIISSKDLNLSFISKKSLAEISYIIGICHDVGKYTIHFQRYINKEKNFDPQKKKHSVVSAFFAFEILNKYCSEYNLEYLIPFIGAFVIRKHHGDLGVFEECLLIEENHNDNQILMDQINDIFSTDQCFNELNDLLPLQVNFQELHQNILQLIGADYKKRTRYLKKHYLFDLRQNKEIIEWFLIIELLYSVLVDSDKKNAADLPESDIESIEIDGDVVNNFIEKKKEKEPEKYQENKINKLKTRFFNQCVQNADLVPEQKIYSISAPTGIGKTFTSFATALNLKKQVKEKVQKDYKIHYILPFTTIIDQNYEEIKEILSLNYENFSTREHDYLLKHHYLAIPEKGYLTKINEDDRNYNSKSYLDDLLFIKSWDAKVVVSTYLQLLHTIIGGKNSFMNKFHNIANSIIILDEVQCIDLKYWEILREIFKQLADKFNVYFIFVTATQPLIFAKNEIKELGKPEEFFNNPIFNRVEIYKYLEKKQTIDAFYENFKHYELNNLRNRYLFVLNTKRSSLALYKRFREDKEQNGFYKDYDLIYLSTNLTPNDRRKKLHNVIKNNRNPEKRYIIITTQLIEAGVDISSDVCYRDFAPMDSLIQSAGRCNRFGEIEKGEFNIIKLYDETTLSEFSWIYGKPILERTEKTLKESNLNESKDFFDLASKFFENCWTESGETKEHSDKLFEHIHRLDFYSILHGREKFSFISSYPTHTLLILDNNSYKEFEKYKEILKASFTDDDEFESIKKGELKKQRKILSQFTIEITPRQLNSIGAIEKDNDLGEHLYILRIDESIRYRERLYSEECGFDLDYDTEEGCFI